MHKERLKGLAALQYVWDYYKLQLFIAALCLYLLFYFIYRDITRQTPVLYLAYVNLEVGETLDGQLTEGFLSYARPSEKNSVVKTLPDLVLSEKLQDLDASYLHASQVKIFSAIDSQRLDVVLMNREAFDAFSQNGYLMDVDSFLKTHGLSLAGASVVENVEILKDNAVEVLLDPSVSYQAQVNTYPCGLDVTACPIIEEAGFPDQVFLGILANTPRQEMVATYLSYLCRLPS